MSFVSTYSVVSVLGCVVTFVKESIKHFTHIHLTYCNAFIPYCMLALSILKRKQLNSLLPFPSSAVVYQYTLSCILYSVLHYCFITVFLCSPSLPPRSLSPFCLTNFNGFLIVSQSTTAARYNASQFHFFSLSISFIDMNVR